MGAKACKKSKVREPKRNEAKDLEERKKAELDDKKKAQDEAKALKEAEAEIARQQALKQKEEENIAREKEAQRLKEEEMRLLREAEEQRQMDEAKARAEEELEREREEEENRRIEMEPSDNDDTYQEEMTPHENFEKLPTERDDAVSEATMSTQANRLQLKPSKIMESMQETAPLTARSIGQCDMTPVDKNAQNISKSCGCSLGEMHNENKCDICKNMDLSDAPLLN